MLPFSPSLTRAFISSFFVSLPIEYKEILHEQKKLKIPTKVDNNVRTPEKNKNNKRKIPESTRHQVWNNHFDSNDGECYSCKKILKQNESWNCGHICSENRGGSLNPFNMRPVCSNCNKKMGTQHMYLWMVLEGYGKNFVGDTPSITMHKLIFENVENAKRDITTLSEFNKITEKEKRIYARMLKNPKTSYDELFSILDIINSK